MKVEFECFYECTCGRKIVAYDDHVLKQKCVCGELLDPLKVRSYNMTQVRHWLFWDQVFGYTEGAINESCE